MYGRNRDTVRTRVFPSDKVRIYNRAIFLCLGLYSYPPLLLSGRPTQPLNIMCILQCVSNQYVLVLRATARGRLGYILPLATLCISSGYQD